MYVRPIKEEKSMYLDWKKMLNERIKKKLTGLKETNLTENENNVLTLQQ